MLQCVFISLHATITGGGLPYNTYRTAVCQILQHDTCSALNLTDQRPGVLVGDKGEVRLSSMEEEGSRAEGE
ncbi:hypothetical protein RRG08_014382 [Elysia crispata]|uniref:Uncharacterized protein n=1 Tax=Elysia crispata TaxID=231223 RepID=A0AAE0YNN4_9GAST|nr:hypothetical protein RRG08_014382 [Elysia crispata]